jgi:hypothetical protein
MTLEKAGSHREHRVHREKSAGYNLFVAHPQVGRENPRFLCGYPLLQD